jgi:GTP-binding protein LepA
MDYEITHFREDDLVKVDILLNGEIVDALSLHLPPRAGPPQGRRADPQAQGLHPARRCSTWPSRPRSARKVVARTNVKALRKDVTAKCYGGDISRKRKLLDKQKKGKKRMKSLGTVEVPQEAFLAVLSLGED